MGRQTSFGYEPRGAKAAIVVWFIVELLLALFRVDGLVQWMWLLVFVLLCFGVASLSARRR